MFTFETIVFPILLVIIFLSTRNDESSNALTINNSQHLRGVFALCIMIFHISKETDLLYPVFAYLGITVVGAFFFLSGYGLMKGFLNKPDYHKGYLLKRITKLFLPYLFMAFVYWLYDNQIGETHSILFALKSIFGSETLVMYSWFIKDIIRHYVVFYLLMILFKDRKRMMYYVSMVFFLIRFFATLFVIEIPTLFDGMFSLGMMFAYKEDTVIPFICKRKNILAVSSFVIAVLLRIEPIYSSRFSLTEKIIFMLFILSFFSGKRIKNRFLETAGKLSLELYMSHGLAKKIIRRFYGGPLFIQDFLIYVLAFVISYAVNLIFSSLDNRIRKFLSNRI